MNPQLMISLWVYAYSQGVGSARAIEQLCEWDPAYRWLTGTAVVNAHSLSDFRVEHEEVGKKTFVRILALLSADGLITLERVMQDRTKIRALAEVAEFRHKIQTEEARKIYRQRAQIAETPNLWIKAKFRLRQFNVRGLRKVGMEPSGPA